jgi:hypothetical protein
MTPSFPDIPPEIDQLLELVREHHSRLHHQHDREPLVTTEGIGARCVGVRCHLEPDVFGRLVSYLEALGLTALCCPEGELPDALRNGWEPLHLQPEFGGVEFAVDEQIVLCRQA